MKTVFICFLFLTVTGCQGLSDFWRGKPRPPVTAAEWNETEKKILVHQVATLRTTEAQIQAECYAYKARKEAERTQRMRNSRPPVYIPADYTPCPSVSRELDRAEYLLWRQNKARQILLEQQQ